MVHQWHRSKTTIHWCLQVKRHGSKSNRRPLTSSRSGRIQASISACIPYTLPHLHKDERNHSPESLEEPFHQVLLEGASIPALMLGMVEAPLQLRPFAHHGEGGDFVIGSCKR